MVIAKTIHHPNGYSAKLYGKSSMSIYFRGKEVSHTGSRNVNKDDEVKELLDKYPELMESISKIVKDGGIDE
jgi:hypothetical protein